MSNVTEVVKTLSLDLSNIPRSKRKEAKDEVSDYLLNEVLRSVNDGISPVKGEGRFRILTNDYAKGEKAGVRTANLELEGDLLNALKVENKRGNDIEIGVRGKEAPKADGHNQISGEAKAWARRTGRTKYKRRFIPDDNQDFSSGIKKGISNILDEYRVDPAEEILNRISFPVGEVSNVAQTEVGTGITVNDLFSDESIEGLLNDALGRF